MSRNSEYSVKSVSKGVSSLVFVGLTFAIPIYAGYHLLKKKDESLKDENKVNPLYATGGAIAVWYLAWKLSGMENG